MHLLPDAQLDFLISYSSAGKTSNREAVSHAFLDRLPALPESGRRPVVGSAEDTQLLSCHYILSRRSRTTLLKVLTAAREAKVHGNGDGTLGVSDLKDPNGELKGFVRLVR